MSITLLPDALFYIYN